MRLNAMLTKKQICGCITVLLLEFQRLTAAGCGGTNIVAAWYRGLGGVADGVLASPDLRAKRELWRGRERTAQFVVVPVQIETRTKWDDHELRELAKPVAERPPVAGLHRITTSDGFEVFGGPPRHFQPV